MSPSKVFPVCMVGRNKLFREALKHLLSNLQFQVVAEFDDVDEMSLGGPLFSGGPNGNDNPEVELILFDLHSDSDEFANDLRLLRQRFPEIPVVVLTEAIRTETLETCLTGGAGGYLTKEISLDALRHSLLLVMLGEKVFPSHLADMLVHGMNYLPNEAMVLGSPVKGRLSGREREILSCLVRGDSNKLIAIRLNITEATVKVHMKNLLRKISASNRTQAAIWAVKNRLLAEGSGSSQMQS